MLSSLLVSRPRLVVSPVGAAAGAQQLLLPSSRVVFATRRAFSSAASSDDDFGGNSSGGGKRRSATMLESVHMIGIDRRPMFPSYPRVLISKDASLFSKLVEVAVSDKPYVVAVMRKSKEVAEGAADGLVGGGDGSAMLDGERLWATPGSPFGGIKGRNNGSDPHVVSSLDEVHHVGVLSRIVKCEMIQSPVSPETQKTSSSQDRRKGRTPPSSSSSSPEKNGDGNTPKESLWSTRPESKSENALTPLSSDTAPDQGKYWMLALLGDTRVAVDSIVAPPDSKNVLPLVSVSALENKPIRPDQTREVEALKGAIMKHAVEIVAGKSPQTAGMAFLSSDPVSVSDVRQLHAIAPFAMLSSSPEEQQALLESVDLVEQLKLVLTLLQKELDLASLGANLSKEVSETMNESQRKYFLMEQLRAIKKELGMDNEGKDGHIEKIKKRLKGFVLEEATPAEKEKEIEEQNIQSGKSTPKDFALMPRHAAAVIEEELAKMQTLTKDGSEFNVSRTYLEWLTSLPWGRYSTESYDLARAAKILDDDHYGLKDVKQRILEFIAVSKLRGSAHGKILCLVGPPGVGKTSIGKSIARALNREYVRISVGGLYDVSEIKGHRRTYIGAMPGKFIQSIRQAKVSNPLLMIDEIDKLGRGHGNPAHALLELLDPSQNSAFMDHYLDVRYDASKVLFVCTANSLEDLQGPLLDRMEVIRISGYDSREKLEIAKKYLIPKAKEAVGLGKSDSQIKLPEGLEMTDSTIEALIRWYCREAGVRSLEKQIEKAFRKLARKVVETPAEDLDKHKWTITESNLEEYVGKPLFHSDRLFEGDAPPGVVTGLAWTGMGGTVLYIETTAVRTPRQQRPGSPSTSDKNQIVGEPVATTSGGGRLFSTGQMGDVMKESSQIAYTYAHTKMQKYDPSNTFFESAQIHMHVPEGAVKKDGPSAGCAMTTALLSLALNEPVADGLAMTGEISLTGMVLPVGGIREKTIAAKAARVNKLVLPVQNKRDFDELEDYIKSGLDVTFAKKYDEVFKIAFPKLSVTATTTPTVEEARM